MKRAMSILITILLMLYIPTFATDLHGDAKSVILMEQRTGTVLYEYNADEALPPASVTKIMTLLLVVEAIDRGELSLTDKVSVSTNASSMGGSQIYLKEGEVMTVDDLLKSVVVASANDAALALAEHLAGNESAFVAMMNQRAQELGMVNTQFENTNGLDDTTTSHLTSARDIALMSAELLSHPIIFNYTTIWMDTVRNGQFGLTNTNRLIKYYPGANGLKTGSTSKAGFCISATAERDGMQLIAVIMGSSTRDARNATAQAVLDHGFANYAFETYSGMEIFDIPLKGGKEEKLTAAYDGFEVVRERNAPTIEQTVSVREDLIAPITVGDVIGSVIYTCKDEVIREIDILSTQNIDRLQFFDVLWLLVEKWFLL